MTLKNQNSWKIFSIALLGVIAIGLVTPISAVPPSGDYENQFDAIYTTLDSLQDQITAAINADGDKDSSNEDQTLTTNGGDVVLGTTAAGDGGGTVTCTDITGDASLCDGDDADTTYTAGTGLNLAGTEFSADTSVMQRRVLGECLAGYSIRSISSTGTVTCEKDTDTTYGNTDFATSGQSCSAGMVVTGIDENGDVTCAADNSGATHKFYTLRNLITVPAYTLQIYQIHCQNGDDIALSGGYSRNPNDDLKIVDSVPDDVNNVNEGDVWSWQINNYYSSDPHDVEIWVKCLDLDGDFDNSIYPLDAVEFDNDIILHWESP